MLEGATAAAAADAEEGGRMTKEEGEPRPRYNQPLTTVREKKEVFPTLARYSSTHQRPNGIWLET